MRPLHPRSAEGSTDVGNFIQAEAKLKAQSQSKGSKIRDLIASTQEKFDKASDTISEIEDLAEPWNVSKEAVGYVLAPLRDVVAILDQVAQVHPYLQVIAGVTKIVIQMELDRRDNDAQVAVVYFSMNSLLLLLPEFARIAGGKIGTSLKERLSKMRSSIAEFGNFCRVYYDHGSFIRTVKSKSYKNQLVAYSQDFFDQKQELHLLLSAQSAISIADIRIEVTKITSLLKIQSRRESEMTRLVASMGGLDTVLADDQKLENLARRVGETLDATVTRTLRTTLTDVITDNFSSFSNKLFLTVKEQLRPFVAKLEDGPHQDIRDDDIKEVWSKMKAQTSVETRIFLDALYNYFDKIFSEHKSSTGLDHKDTWTLHFLSRGYFRPAIGDGIDEDSSGFISLPEINRFLKSKPAEMKCSNVAWIAFWAVGPYKTDLEFLRKIRVLRARLKRAPTKLIEVSDDVLPALGELEAEHVEYKALEELRCRWRDLRSEEIHSKLETMEYELKGPDDVSLIIGGWRLENHIMPFIYLLLRHHMTIVKLSRKQQVPVRVFEKMRDTWMSVFEAFGRRFGVLVEVWRQQRLNLETQAASYNRGVFKLWYERDRARAWVSSLTTHGTNNDDLHSKASVSDDDEVKGVPALAEPSAPEDESALVTDVLSDWIPKQVMKYNAQQHLRQEAERSQQTILNVLDRVQRLEDSDMSLREMMGNILNILNESRDSEARSRERMDDMWNHFQEFEAISRERMDDSRNQFQEFEVMSRERMDNILNRLSNIEHGIARAGVDRRPEFSLPSPISVHTQPLSPPTRGPFPVPRPAPYSTSHSPVYIPPPALRSSSSLGSPNRDILSMLGKAKMSMRSYSAGEGHKRQKRNAMNSMHAPGPLILDMLTPVARKDPQLQLLVNLVQASIAPKLPLNVCAFKVAVVRLCMYYTLYQLVDLNSREDAVLSKVLTSLSQPLSDLSNTVNRFASTCDSIYRLLLKADSSVQADRYASNKLPAYVNEFANHKNALRDVMRSTERSIVNEPELGDVMPFLANVGSPNFLLLL